LLWLGIEVVTAAVWANWIVPLVICKIALRWQDGEANSVTSPVLWTKG